MKKILFFLLLLFTWYLGGMYRYLPLMVLLVAEVQLAATFLILSRYFCRRTRAGFAKAFDTAQAGQEMSCQIWSAYSGPLPPDQCPVAAPPPRDSAPFGFGQDTRPNGGGAGNGSTGSANREKHPFPSA